MQDFQLFPLHGEDTVTGMKRRTYVCSDGDGCSRKSCVKTLLPLLCRENPLLLNGEEQLLYPVKQHRSGPSGRCSTNICLFSWSLVSRTHVRIPIY